MNNLQLCGWHPGYWNAITIINILNKMFKTCVELMAINMITLGGFSPWSPFFRVLVLVFWIQFSGPRTPNASSNFHIASFHSRITLPKQPPSNILSHSFTIHTYTLLSPYTLHSLQHAPQ